MSVITIEPQNSSAYEFHDIVVKECIELYFDKDAIDLNVEDYTTLAQLHVFSFDIFNRHVRSLQDLPLLFPSLRYFSLAYSWFDEAQLSLEDCVILEEMETLRAVDIYADGLPSLAFVERLPYASLRYTERAYLSDDNNLAEASVLGRDFIEDRVTGHVMEYVKVVDGSHVYELIVTDYEHTEDIWYEWNEARIFISERRNDEYFFVDCFDVPGRIPGRCYAHGGLILIDVNFDGQKDILVLQGHFGTQAAVRYACFLNSGETYEINESFSYIMNPTIDEQNMRILSTWRNHSMSHSWAIFSFENGAFIETDRLTEEPEETGGLREEGLGVEIIVWKNTIERFSSGYTETEEYLTSDYTDDEWLIMFYNEDSFWGLLSDKWRTLRNQGHLLDWSLYGNGLDTQIMALIS